ncbi:hypothetical protein HK098_002833 [Nowakowskiella sp. JEL0407]|nr:hypothetical protein HK098_002833 [Nowakowskiella sp. JEL0407]
MQKYLPTHPVTGNRSSVLAAVSHVPCTFSGLLDAMVIYCRIPIWGFVSISDGNSPCTRCTRLRRLCTYDRKSEPPPKKVSPYEKIKLVFENWRRPWRLSKLSQSVSSNTNKGTGSLNGLDGIPSTRLLLQTHTDSVLLTSDFVNVTPQNSRESPEQQSQPSEIAIIERIYLAMVGRLRDFWIYMHMSIGMVGFLDLHIDPDELELTRKKPMLIIEKGCRWRLWLVREKAIQSNVANLIKGNISVRPLPTSIYHSLNDDVPLNRKFSPGLSTTFLNIFDVEYFALDLRLINEAINYFQERLIERNRSIQKIDEHLNEANGLVRKLREWFEGCPPWLFLPLSLRYSNIAASSGRCQAGDDALLEFSRYNYKRLSKHTVTCSNQLCGHPTPPELREKGSRDFKFSRNLLYQVASDRSFQWKVVQLMLEDIDRIYELPAGENRVDETMRLFAGSRFYRNLNGTAQLVTYITSAKISRTLWTTFTLRTVGTVIPDTVLCSEKDSPAAAQVCPYFSSLTGALQPTASPTNCFRTICSFTVPSQLVSKDYFIQVTARDCDSLFGIPGLICSDVGVTTTDTSDATNTATVSAIPDSNSPKPGELPVGAIFGIALAVIVAVLAVIAGVRWNLRKNRKPEELKMENQRSEQEYPPVRSAEYSGHQQTQIPDRNLENHGAASVDPGENQYNPKVQVEEVYYYAGQKPINYRM